MGLKESYTFEVSLHTVCLIRRRRIEINALLKVLPNTLLQRLFAESFRLFGHFQYYS